MTATHILMAGLLAVLGTPAAAQDAPYGYAAASYDTDGQSVDSIAVFFEPLSHYGRWLDSRFGRVWTPNVGRDWRPYTIGHWEAGAFGQTWRSDEPFGWAVFHFGRWAFDPAIGWVWSPDTVWGPGWVAWRDGDEVTGWAPLPPQVDVLYAGNFGNDWGYDQWYQPGWVYVPRGNLYARQLRGVYLPYARNHEQWERTRGVTHYDRQNGQVVNRSFGGRDDGRYNRDRRGDDGRQGFERRDDGGRQGSERRDDGSRDLRTQNYAVSPSVGGVSTGGEAHGFVPMPRGYGGYGGFVPGTPRGGYRPVMPPAGMVPRPTAPVNIPVAPRPGTPPRAMMPMPMPRAALPMPAPMMRQLAPVAPRPAAPHDDRHH